MQKLGIRGETLIKGFEKLEIKGYKCPAGVPTIGWGHVILKGEPYKVGQTISLDEAVRLLDKDTDRFEACVRNSVKVRLTQNQFDALVSLAFNIGEGAFKGSSLLRELNKGNYSVASAKFLQWNKATVRGKLTVLRGLTRRRIAEQVLFETK